MPALTVTALSMRSSRTSAPAGATFEITIHVHLTQRMGDVPWLVLPNLTNLTILGDEKHTTPASGDGTDYVEILSVAGVTPGMATLTPAYIDARDPSRGGKPFRFSSNALRIPIRGDAAVPAFDWGPLVRATLRIASIAAVALGAIVAAFLAFGAVRRRRQRYVLLPVAKPVQSVTPQDRTAPIRVAATRLSGVRSRENAASVRAALFAYAGARSDETLATLLERIPASSGLLRDALRAAERATFVDEPNLQGAIGELLDAVRRMGLG